LVTRGKKFCWEIFCNLGFYVFELTGCDSLAKIIDA
jgi:hypothetical protein